MTGSKRRTPALKRLALAVTAGSMALAQAHAAVLNVTARNQNGAPVAGATVALYDHAWSWIGNQTASGSGVATWNDLAAGTYNLEVYSNGEFWVSGSATVRVGTTATSLSLQRNEPYTFEFKVFSGEAEVTRGSIPAGTALRYEVRVRNSSPVGRRVRVQFRADRNGSSPYDFGTLAGPQLIAGRGSIATFRFTHVPVEAGTYKRIFETETLVKGRWVKTDSWPWEVAFQALLPLGGKIAYHSYSSYMAAPQDSEDGHIYLCPLPRGPLRKLTQGLPVSNAMNPHISPDGSRVTFMAIPQGADRDRRSLEIYVYDLATETLARLTSNDLVDEDPKFAPDGRRILFKRNNQIWRMNDDGSDAIPLTRGEDEKSGPNYSPDGSRVVYWSGSAANADIWSLSSTGTQKLMGTPRLQEYYPIYRDAENILFTRWESETEQRDKIFNYSTVSETATRLSLNRVDANDSDPFPIDRVRIGFSSDRSGGKGAYDVYIADLAAGTIYPVAAANGSHNDLGGWYSPYSRARRLTVLTPTSGAVLTSGSTVLVTVQAHSDGSSWSGAIPKVVLQGPVNLQVTGLRDDGLNGDRTAGDGIYSKMVTLPARPGSYVLWAVADSSDNGSLHEIRSVGLNLILSPET